MYLTYNLKRNEKKILDVSLITNIIHLGKAGYT